jgi:ATP-dependent DNA ligase
VPYSPERVLSSLPIVRTPSPHQLVGDAEGQWIAETPHTVDQLQKQAQYIQDLLRRQSQSPTNQAIRQLVKGCQLAMHSAAILVEENTKLQAAVQRRERKQRQRRQYIARGGALQAQEGQRLATEADIVAQEAEQVAQPGRPRAPPTCTKCYVQGHKRTQCTTR